MGAVLDSALALNIIADVYFKFKQAGVPITPENIRAHIDALEARAAANDEALGLTEPNAQSADSG